MTSNVQFQRAIITLILMMPNQLLLTIILMNFDKFVSTEIPNDNINDSVTVNHPYQNDRVPVQHTNQNVQVVLPKQNQTVKYYHGQNP